MTSNKPDRQEDPPPYTPTPTLATGESTLEHGPFRPFQSTTPLAADRVQPQITTRPTSLFRHLTTSLNNFVNQLDHPQESRTQDAYPGQHEASLRQSSDAGPSSSPRPPPVAAPSSSNRSSSSGFSRDFYAAGTGEGFIPPGVSPPPGLPPRQAQSFPNSTPDDGRPTPYPAIGHPLLNDGKVLVYPRGYKCHKCDNIGYKDADPSRPCKRCWNKYARPLSGPLAYSFSSTSTDGNFQRPLPPPVPPRPSIFEPPGAFQSNSFPPQQTGFGRSPRIVHGAPSSHPINAVVYSAGDPRIGGVRCWSCGGKGHVNFLLFDSINCEICGGVGRVFV